MNTELVKVLRFDPIIDYNKKGSIMAYTIESSMLCSVGATLDDGSKICNLYI